MRPVPIDQLERRLPTAGRIRIGRIVPGRGGKPRPDKLANFRFTSQDEASVHQVAGLYGGEVGPWKGHEGQWEVFTPATMVRVVMPPDPLGNSPIYELWDGGGCLRRCTGRIVQLRTQGPDGGDVVEQDCICWQRGKLECQRKTRLSVILPEVRFLGVWRLDTSSKIASEQLPGMVDTFEHLRATRGLPFAELRLERTRVPKGWAYIPTLGFDQTPAELAMTGPPMGGLPSGPIALPAELPEPEPEAGPIAVSAYHPDPDLVAAWKDSLTTTQQNKVLALCREGWGSADMPPATFDDIPLEVVDVFMEKGVEAVERQIRG